MQEKFLEILFSVDTELYVIHQRLLSVHYPSMSSLENSTLLAITVRWNLN